MTIRPGITALDFESHSVRACATKIRSSPRKRGPRAAQRDPHIVVWIPACAGMNGVRATLLSASTALFEAGA